MSPGEGTGATMSEDEDEQVESDAHLYDGSLDGLGFGPLVPTESERSLMERVRQELKHELKQVTNDIYYLHHILLHIVSSVKLHLHCPLYIYDVMMYKHSFFLKGYKEKIVDIREEILRKRRAGKLPGDTTSVLKAWWQSHSKWPYPTVSPYPSYFFNH